MHTDPEVLALLALGEDESATPDERHHVAGCAICQQEVAELAHLAGVGRGAGGPVAMDTPSPAVWARIQAELGFGSEVAAAPDAPAATTNGVSTLTSEQTSIPVSSEPRPRFPAAGRPADPTGPAEDGRASGTAPEPELRPVTDLTARRPHRGRRILSLALAAVLALVVGIGVGTLVQRSRSGDDGTVVGQAKLEALPKWTGAAGQARLVLDANGNKIMRVSLTSPQPLDGDQQVWLIDSLDLSRMVPLGYLGADRTGFWTLPPSVDLSTYDLVDVSEEPPGDLSTAHSGNSIVRGPLES